MQKQDKIQLRQCVFNKKKQWANIAQSTKTIPEPITAIKSSFCYKFQRPGIASSQHENVSSSSPQTASKLSSSDSQFSTVTDGFKITKPIGIKK